MKEQIRKHIKILILIYFLVVTLIVVARTLLIFNQSPSMPVGIYRKSLEGISRGKIIGACIPKEFAILAKKRDYLDFGVCTSELRPVMKYVVAIPGDSVEVRLDKTLVNGRVLNDSRLILKDSKNRLIPNQLGKHKLKPGQYWLFSNHHPGSLDSRYFGAVTETLSVVKPLLTLNQLCKITFLKNTLRCKKEIGQ